MRLLRCEAVLLRARINASDVLRCRMTCALFKLKRLTSEARARETSAAIVSRRFFSPYKRSLSNINSGLIDTLIAGNHEGTRDIYGAFQGIYYLLSRSSYLYLLDEWRYLSTRCFNTQ